MFIFYSEREWQMSERIDVTEIFGKNVFNDSAMREKLPKSVYKN